MMDFMVHHDGPVYMRVCRNDVPEVTVRGNGIAPAVLREGTDMALISCGIMTAKALEAAALLESEGISARVVNVPCVKPLDEAAIVKLTSGVRAVVTCEEHSVIGGLSQAVCWALRGKSVPLDAVAVMDAFGQSTHTPEELQQAGATPCASIAQAVVVVTMLPNSPQVIDVVMGEGGVLDAASKGLIIADTSSIAPAASQKVAEVCTQKGVVYLDCPPPLRYPRTPDCPRYAPGSIGTYDYITH